MVERNRKPTNSYYIVVKGSGIHGKGVFAKKDIKKGTKIIEYVGELIDKKESERRCDKHIELSEEDEDYGAVYVFELNDKYDIDGSVDWNTAKWINHSCNPNCETEGDDDHIWIMAMKDIKKGDELTYDYGYDLDNWEDHPCKCGSDNCMGYIVDQKHWGKLKKEIAKKIK